MQLRGMMEAHEALAVWFSAGWSRAMHDTLTAKLATIHVPCTDHFTAAADFLFSGQKHAAPHLRIFELMDPPEKSAVWWQDRRQLHVVVLLRLGCKPVLRITTGSSYEGMKKLHSYSKDDGEPYKVLSGAEYVDCVVSALADLKRARDGKLLPPVKYLLHDKAPQHTCKYTKEELPKHIQLQQLPTDSQDLTPCDTNFFAVVKGRWQMETLRDSMS